MASYLLCGGLEMDCHGKMVGKLALVTGAGTGIGREVALEFAREGAAVVVHYAHSATGAQAAAEEITASGGRALTLQADLGCVEDVRQLAKESLEFLGGVDILVNNAGITMNLPFERVTPEQFDTLYHVNVRAPFFLTQAMLPAMLARGGGAVINFSSVHALAGSPEHSVYAGTKGAITSYTRELAIELAPKGVRVNAIAPGAVPVDSHFRAIPDFDPTELGRSIPAGFAGTPHDIARVAVFLASDEARYIVGQTLIVDGGTTSWLPFCEGFRRPVTARFGRGYVPGL
jgi:NAD(P)-dependent dehydrogenase (short-subunit alcohol dehydrogenase family)